MSPFIQNNFIKSNFMKIDQEDEIHFVVLEKESTAE
jgi:hypothetical protein